MTIKLLRNIALVAVTLGVLLVPADARAFNPFSAICSSDKAASGSTVCQQQNSNGDPLTGSNGIFRKLANVIALTAGIIAIFILIIAGLTYITAGGEAGKIKQAQDMARYAIIGLVVIAVADSIVSYVLSHL